MSDRDSGRWGKCGQAGKGEPGLQILWVLLGVRWESIGWCCAEERDDLTATPMPLAPGLLLRLRCSNSGSPAGLAKTCIADPHPQIQWVWGRDRDFASLTSSQVVLLPLIWRRSRRELLGETVGRNEGQSTGGGRLVLGLAEQVGFGRVKGRIFQEKRNYMSKHRVVCFFFSILSSAKRWRAVYKM